MTQYNSNLLSDRQALAEAILKKLAICEFVQQPSNNPNQELIFGRFVNDTKIQVLVYTSIVNGEVRLNSEDAVRVSGIYNQKGLVSDRRINRVGTIEEIVERMYERMRNVWSACTKVERCADCGAPKFLSRNNNKVCADICWVKNGKS